jgi:hypothetical protein
VSWCASPLGRLCRGPDRLACVCESELVCRAPDRLACVRELVSIALGRRCRGLNKQLYQANVLGHWFFVFEGWASNLSPREIRQSVKRDLLYCQKETYYTNKRDLKKRDILNCQKETYYTHKRDLSPRKKSRKSVPLHIYHLQDLISVKRALISVKRDLISVKRDLISVVCLYRRAGCR